MSQVPAVAQPKPVRTKKPKRPLLKSFRFWVPVVLLLILLAVIFSAAVLVPRALTAQGALKSAVPLAGQAKDQVFAGDTDAAAQTLAELGAAAAEADEATDFWLWRAYERVPVIGENLKAVRLASTTLSRLTDEVLPPLSGLSLDALKPVDGAIDVAALAALAPQIDAAAAATEAAAADIAGLNSEALIDPVREGVEKLDGALDQLSGILAPAQTALQILPEALGADGPRNYLLLFQNNAEIRTTGGNPAAIALVTAENGRVGITQQASSADFNNHRPESIAPLNPETQAIYGEKVGTSMQDVTLTPDFGESARLMRAFWAESFGTPIDAVVSFDPIALSYLLEATGPVTLETGDVLTADNAVQLLLSEVYARYPKGQDQDAFFASAADRIFSAVTGGQADTRALVTALGRAAEEGRLMYVSADEAQMALLGASPVAGPLPADNAEASVLGVFFNDLTVGKMDYYLYADVTAESTQCSVGGGAPATFTATTHLRNPIDAALRDALPAYVKANAYGYHGAIHTDVLVYGPVGTKIQSVEVDGEIVGIGDRYDGEYREMTHLGRPVLQVPILLRMQTEATVTVTFAAADDQPADAFGPFELRATPTVHETPIEVRAPGCE